MVFFETVTIIIILLVLVLLVSSYSHREYNIEASTNHYYQNKTNIKIFAVIWNPFYARISWQ
jgi:Na+/pantothenate symporter